jgi:uncharacterized repeat protein (TIGR01451 family)
MKPKNLRPKTKSAHLHNRTRIIEMPSAGSLLRLGAILILAGLLAGGSYWNSAAAISKKTVLSQNITAAASTIRRGLSRQAAPKKEAFPDLRELLIKNGGYALPLPVLQSSPAILATYASDCTTPKTVFSVGDTVCAKLTNVPFFPRRLLWATDSTVIHSSNITSSTHTDSFVIDATSTLNGKTIDNRGTWQLVVLNPFFFFPEISTTFLVVDPANATADLGITTIGESGAVQAGSQAVFQLQVNNYGPDSSVNVVLTDAIPDGTTFVSFQQLSGPVFSCNNPAANSGTGASVCSIASLNKGDTATFVATYDVSGTASAGDEIFNTASISGLTSDNPDGTDDQHPLNNSTTGTTTVDSSPCVLTCPTDIIQDVDSGQAGAIVIYPAPTSTSNCGSANDITSSPASGSFFPVGTTAVTSTSAAGGGICTFLVIINNPGGLSISLNGPNPFQLECGNDFADPGATAVNGVGDPVPVEVSGTVSNHTPGSYSLTYTATEDQNSVSTTRTVNVSDADAPVITLQGPNPMTITSGQTFVDPGASASDACEGAKPVNSSGTVDSNTPGTYTITYTASDSQNHTATATRSVIVESDATAPPTITMNGDPQTTIECGATFTDPGATATVSGGGQPDQFTTDNPVDSHTPGTYIVTYTACMYDSPGHCDPNRTSQAERTVTVEDTAAPTITVNGANPMTVECHATFTDPGATAHDACAGDFSATASGSVNPNVVGSYTITYNAGDPSGHAAAAVARIVNVVDTTAPIVTAPANVTVNTGAGAPSCSVSVSDATLGLANATDSCDGSLPTIRSGVPPGNIFPAGTTTITYSASDASNNTGTATQTVTVVDNSPPTVTPPPAVTLYTGPGATSCGVTVGNLEATLGNGSAGDNCAGVSAVTRGGVPAGNVFPLGQTTLTYSATDAHGNTSSATQVVTVVDNTPPTISCLANINADFNAAVNGAVVTYTAPLGVDNCGATTTQTAGLPSGATFPVGTTTNTFTVTDNAGLTASCSFKVTVALTSIIGLDSVSISGTGLVDSYDSTGGYPATKGSLANVVSNGTITLAGSAKVFGNVRSTRAGVAMSGASRVTGNATAGTTVSRTGSASVGGTITNNQSAPLMTLPSVPACAPFSPNSGISGTYSYSAGTGDLNLTGINIATLANGTYCFHNVTVGNSAQLKVNGPVVIRMTGTLNASGATSLTNTTGIPGNLRVMSSYSGTNGVTFGNASNAHLVVYAPRTGVAVSGAAPLFGTVAGRTITISNSGMIHYDTRLKTIWPDIWTLIFGH